MDEVWRRRLSFITHSSVQSADTKKSDIHIFVQKKKKVSFRKRKILALILGGSKFSVLICCQVMQLGKKYECTKRFLS